MKIVHVCIANPYIDGWTYQENLLPEAMAALGHDVTVIASTTYPVYHTPTEEEKLERDYQLGRVKVRRLKLRHSYLNRFMWDERIVGIIGEISPELLFIHNPQDFLLSKLEKYKKAHPHTVVFADAHTSRSNSAKGFVSEKIIHKIMWRKIIRGAMPHVDRFFVLSNAQREFLREMYLIPDEMIGTAPLSAVVEPELLERRETIRKEKRAELGIPEDAFVLVHGGKLTKGKRTTELCEAMKRLPDNCCLIVFGDARPEDYEKKIRAYAAADERIKYIGWIDGEKVVEYYFAADMGVFPGGPSVLWQQAIAAGLPLVCSYAPGREYLDVGGNMLFLASYNESVIAGTLSLLLSSPQTLEKMKAVAENEGRSFFSYERISKMLIDKCGEIRAARAADAARK